MSQPQGRIYVDPEGVSSLGDQYAEHRDLYDGYVSQLEDLRSRYGNAWGDDDMGKAFGEKFIQGLDSLSGLVKGVRGTLDYTAEGLRGSGQRYRQVDEEGKEAGRLLEGAFDEIPLQPRQAMVAEQAPYAQEAAPRKLAMMSQGRTEQGELLPRKALKREQGQLLRKEAHTNEPGQMMQGRLVEGRKLASRKPVTPEPEFGVRVDKETGESTRTVTLGNRSYDLKPMSWTADDDFLADDNNLRLVTEGVDPETGEPRYTRMSMGGEAYEMELRSRWSMSEGEVTPALRVEGQTMEPAQMTEPRQYSPGEEPMEALTPALQGEPAQYAPAQYAQASQMTPAISAYMMKPEYATALIDGVPIADGYHLQALNTFPDGTSRIDANLYDSVSPVGNSLPVTDAEGRPLSPEGNQFFVVKENPNVDPTAEGYQPLYVSFTPEGTAIPLVTDLY